MFHRTAVHLRGLKQRTVWGEFAGDKIPRRFWGLYRIVLPGVYFIIGLYGACTIRFPLTSIDIIFGEIYGDIWSCSLMIAGFVAFVGLAFYDTLIWAELTGVCFIITLLALYSAAIFAAAIWYGESFKYASLLLVIAFIWLPAWRAFDAAQELRPPAHE